jgi:hypothetical protein
MVVDTTGALEAVWAPPRLASPNPIRANVRAIKGNEVLFIEDS